MTNVFSAMAQQYDTPERKELARIIEKKIAEYLQDATDRTLIDYGGGTGLVSLPLAPLVKELQIIDAAPAMIELARQKIQANGLTNTTAEFGYLVSEDRPALTADIFLLSLVLLHIPDTKKILAKIHEQLSDNGELWIVDFVKNPRVQHPLIHNGFDPQELTTLLTKAGFTQITISIIHEGQRLFAGQDAALFLCRAQKAQQG